MCLIKIYFANKVPGEIVVSEVMVRVAHLLLIYCTLYVTNLLLLERVTFLLLSFRMG
jgi:hypothetical protein